MEDILNGYVLQVVIFVCINIILAMTIHCVQDCCLWAMQGS